MYELIVSLLPILIQVESGGVSNAVGDNGQAIGVLQIHKILVDDVNRIEEEPMFRYQDRKNKTLSCRMAMIYLLHYGKHYENITGKKATAEVLCRIWNGGPIGWKKKATVPYWNKCKKIIDSKGANK